MSRLMTAVQVAEEFGLPKARTLTTMRSHGLPCVKLGKQYMFDPADVEAFIAARKESSCRAKTQARASGGTNAAKNSTSIGMRKESSEAFQRAQTTANWLKSGCKNTLDKSSGQTAQIHRIDTK